MARSDGEGMRADQLFVTGAGIFLIGFIYWFFFMKKERAVMAEGKIEIIVDGGYAPAVISVPVGKEVTLSFFRKDPSACLEEVLLSDFGIRRTLPLNKAELVTIRPTEAKEYEYSCGMNMFKGKIIAK